MRTEVVVGKTSGGISAFPSDPRQPGGYGWYSASQRQKVDLCPDCYAAEMRRREHSLTVLWWTLGTLGVLLFLGLSCIAAVFLSR